MVECNENHISKRVLFCINKIVSSQQERKLNWSPTSIYEPLRIMNSIDDKGEVG